MPFHYMPTVIEIVKQNDVQNVVRDGRVPFGEALHKKKFKSVAVEFNAQNVYKKKDEIASEYTGDSENAIGRLCISKEDYDDIALTDRPEKHDVIISISGLTVRYKIVEVRPTGHIDLWSSFGVGVAEHSLFLIFYEQDKEEKPTTLRM